MEVIEIGTGHIEKNSKKNIDNKTNIYYDIFKRKDIAKFTFYDYLYIEVQKKKEEWCCIRETPAEYETMSSVNIYNKYDKTYRKVLGNKRYATYIINEALELTNPIEEKEIEKYTNRYITNDGEEVTNILSIIAKQTTKEEDKKNLISIIRVTLKEKIGQEKLEEIIKEMEGGDKNMLACVEMLREENRRIRAEGRAEEKLKIAKEMKKNNISIELIEKITGLKRNEIE